MPKTSFGSTALTFLTGSPVTTNIKRPKRGKFERSLVGSARVDTIGTREAQSNGSAPTTAQSLQWQQQAWNYYDVIGECHYTSNFLGACLSRCTLTVGLPDDSGHIGPAFDEDGNVLTDDDGNVLPGLELAEEARDLIAALKSDVGGQSQLLRTMGINLTVAGEFHLVGSGPNGTNGYALTPSVGEINQWEVLSTEEFRPMGDNYLRRAMPGATPQEIPGESVHVIRIWRSHPRFSELPDSAMHAVLDILEELQLLTREVRGEALSRLSNGKVFLVPEEIEWPDDEIDDASGEAGDAFTRDLIQTFSTAISDKGSAAQTVPFIIRAPAALLHPDALRTIDLSRTNPSDSAAKRTEAVQRFAQGIDLPVEITSGHSGTTFANAVVIDDSTSKAHIEPVLEIICDGLTAGYLRPALSAPSPLVVFYDSSELVSRPNRAQDAKDLHDRYAVSDATLRTSSGFSDTDAPDDDELMKRIQLRQLANVRQTIAQTPAGLIKEDAGATQSADSNSAIGNALNKELTTPALQAPGGELTQGQNTAASSDAALSAAIIAVSEVSIERAVKRAGARLRSQANKNSALRTQLSQIPDVEIAVTLGPTLIASISKQENLFLGEFDTLRDWVIRSTGSAEFASKLHETCERLANERLFKPRSPFPFDELPER